MLFSRTSLNYHLLIFCAFTLVHCKGSSSHHPPKISQDHAGATRPIQTSIGIGDVFELRVYGEKELSGIHRVSADGAIDVPLVGRTQVSGLSRDGAVDLLTQKLRVFIKSPQVSIFVKERKSKKIFVFGRVKKPGTFEFESNMNIIQAITLAGGFDKLADQNGTYVNRVIDGAEKRIEVSVKDIGQGKAGNFFLEAGDIVYIPESLF